MQSSARTSCQMLLAVAMQLTLAAQAGEPSPRRLSTTGMVEHAETFSRIKNVVELPDGRVVVADAREKRIALLDFPRGRSTAMAREGSGPREFQFPSGMSLGRRGGAMIYDQGQRRFLPILPDGCPGDAIPLPVEVTSFTVSEDANDQFVPDTLGNVVAAVREVTQGGIRTRLVRYDATGRETALGSLRAAESRQLESGTKGMRIRQLVRFSPVDVWAVAPDGWVQRTVADGAPNKYDVFDRRGIVVDRIVVPEAVHLVGFGATSAYAVRTDDDDLLYLQRYPLP